MMQIWQSLLLGIIQGLTEFLPVSSSGHLVIAQKFIHVPDRIAVPFDIAIHLGTLVAVVLYFQKDLRQLIGGLLRREKDSIKLAWFLILGTVPAIVLGLAFKDYIEQLFGSGTATAWQLIINGLMLVVADRLSGTRLIENLNSGDSLWIGLGQAVAIIPGISRSGATMAVGLWRKLSRQAAARFSFLLSIPVILGAGVLGAKDLTHGGYQQIGAVPFWLGVIAAAVSGYLVIKLFLSFLGKGSLRGFGYYCLVLGGVALILLSR
jgi:undecaprenyl-diphosphatase